MSIAEFSINDISWYIPAYAEWNSQALKYTVYINVKSLPIYIWEIFTLLCNMFHNASLYTLLIV